MPWYGITLLLNKKISMIFTALMTGVILEPSLTFHWRIVNNFINVAAGTWFKTPIVFNFAASPHNSERVDLDINVSSGISVSSSSIIYQKKQLSICQKLNLAYKPNRLWQQQTNVVLSIDRIKCFQDCCLELEQLKFLIWTLCQFGIYIIIPTVLVIIFFLSKNNIRKFLVWIEISLPFSANNFLLQNLLCHFNVMCTTCLTLGRRMDGSELHQ